MNKIYLLIKHTLKMLTLKKIVKKKKRVKLRGNKKKKKKDRNFRKVKDAIARSKEHTRKR